jgi:hypothetical protein
MPISSNQLFGVQIPLTDRATLVVLSSGIESYAEKFGLQVETWEEDGLGTARGGFLRLDNGRIVLIREMDHARQNLGCPGPYIEVDMSELESRGAAEILAEVADAMQLGQDDIAWFSTAEASGAGRLRLDNSQF